MLEADTTSGAPALLPRGRQVDFAALSDPARWKPEFAVPYNQRQIGSNIFSGHGQDKNVNRHKHQTPQEKGTAMRLI